MSIYNVVSLNPQPVIVRFALVYFLALHVTVKSSSLVSRVFKHFQDYLRHVAVISLTAAAVIMACSLRGTVHVRNVCEHVSLFGVGVAESVIELLFVLDSKIHSPLFL